ncbi:methionine--tRNA ligase [Candidatus Azambacteria bacterium RIFCSPHIGHO2_02_46_12]|uniref:Methionine--tRNA ligase n=1 Tax=Candidatus Azambacteria bacterium RIFCSPHIGHO2_02_46_12 TaxID=1797295 RepID=A0A1F5BHZ4_9BACT|nr:MAG: methionine--tRNA ligase [Candidatus Azambacteria bacterium RIFCSPHIGHO2_02_46_12]
MLRNFFRPKVELKNFYKMGKFYITTSIAYVNALPHIGYALELAQADVLARWKRLKGDDVFFLTGTDEHGRKIVEAAEKAGKPVGEFVDETAAKFKELAGALNISNNDFVRTTDQKRHWPAVEKMWRKLVNKGDIYKANYKGLYCVGHEAFMKSSELKDGKCPIHFKEPETIEEENYFFRLSRYASELESIILTEEFKIVPAGRKNEILSFIAEGVEDVSFSRPSKDLSWGIPVPDDPTHTIYVWSDALVNYISLLGYAEDGENFQKYWPADVHIIGKDILRFHALIWLAMLLSAGLPLPKNLFVHGFITSGGQKMSKTLGNVIDPFEVIKKYGADAARYYLLREIPPTEDGDFTFEKFEERYNADLANGLGNLVARVLTLAEKRTAKKELKISADVREIIDRAWENYEKHLAEMKFNEALETIWRLIGFCDEYVDKEKPWELLKQGKEKEFDQAMLNLLTSLAHIAWLLEPFMPKTADKIFEQLGIEKTAKDEWDNKFAIKKQASLFPRLPK